MHEEIDEKLEVNRVFETVFLVGEVIVIVLYALVTDYAIGMGLFDVTQDESMDIKETMQSYYPMFQDVHVMIYIGFGFLMVFLKTNSWTAVGFNYLMSAWAFQWGILCVSFWHMVFAGHFEKIHLNVISLIQGDFCAGACMITFGAVLGKVDLFQLWLLVTMLCVIYGLNEAICVEKFKAVDMGGSMYIHTFGAYFGLAASYFFAPKRAMEDKDNRNGGSYTSQYVAMIGTIFLYMFWPSFNSALAPAISQQRVVVNTALSISASCVGAAGVARIIYGKLEMEIMLNATLAGGVIIGACSDVVLAPGASIIIGGCGGIISALGFAFLSKALQRCIGLHDTCGVHNLHGIPGILGGIIGAISASMAGNSINKEAISIIFSAIGEGRSYEAQGGYQMAALGVTLAFAIVGGIISGFCASRIGYEVQTMFADEEHWHGVEFDVPLEKEGGAKAAEPHTYFNQDPEQPYEHEDEDHGKENIN